ncbi:hypothetical protein WJX73_010888 [Symbiochloris irregularis]|uniref:Methyltransferase type 11 domain-containing protein n=1 Tax=Symbiochloris irregularis TaxID=706552 RepID=A0AAW1NYC5_9CHLO
MSQGQYSRLFDAQAAQYKQFRPTYPPELFQQILRYSDSERRHHALDNGTGNGQAAVELAKHYDRVTATDQSAKQLQQAEQMPNVEYKEGSAEAIDLADSSIDLLTVAQALHWFELPTFYAEARRVLRPSGTLAGWGYDRPFVKDQAEVDKLLSQLYSVTLGPYWDDRRRLIEQHYRGMEPPADGWSQVTRQELDMQKPMTVQTLLGYLRSWSSYTSFRRERPEAADPLQLFEQNVLQALGSKDASHELTINFPVFLILAKRH